MTPSLAGAGWLLPIRQIILEKGSRKGKYFSAKNKRSFYKLFRPKCRDAPRFQMRKFQSAERQGFEPWNPCGLHAFQACRFNHSRTSPNERGTYDAKGVVKSPARIDPARRRPKRRDGTNKRKNFYRAARFFLKNSCKSAADSNSSNPSSILNLWFQAASAKR